MVEREDESEAVGYGRPPKAYRFKPGQSGNPRGRPKGSKNMMTLFEQELDAKVTVTEHGERRTITKRQVIAKQLVNKAATGDAKAVRMPLDETRLSEQETNASGQANPFGRPVDAAVMRNVLQRFRNAEPTPSAIETTDTPAAGSTAADVLENPAGEPAPGAGEACR